MHNFLLYHSHTYIIEMNTDCFKTPIVNIVFSIFE